MKLAILDLSYWPPEYMSGEPRFGEVLATWLARGLPDAALLIHDIVEGDPLPAVAAFDGFVISGSDKGVYDDAPWMQPLRDFLLAARAAHKPLLGICFGHQIMADVFGGKAEKVGPPEVGVRHFNLEGTPATAHVWHQDQVTRQPPDTTVIASAPYCPIAGLAYGTSALSVQFHPEYTADFVARFLQRSRGDILTNDHTDDALAQLAVSTAAPDLFANRAGRFFETALAQNPV